MNDAAYRSIDASNSKYLGLFMRVLTGGTLTAGVAIACAHSTGQTAAFGIGVIIFLTSFSVGSFLGFLFGVPRVLSRDSSTGSPAAASPQGTNSNDQQQTADASTNTGARLLQSNTNLERISDWLTTMLVGAGLVELHRINDGLLMFRTFLENSARVYPGQKAGEIATAGTIPVVGPVILVLGATAGFLFMYLNTRLVIIRLFQSIEIFLSGEEVLPPEAQRAVKTFTTNAEGTASFVGQRLSSSSATTVDDAIGLMLDGLYKSNPQRVVDLGASISLTGAVKRADYWFYLAAAFGQIMALEQKGSEKWLSAKDNALDCARRAVAINDAFKERLWKISEPNTYDDDLSELRDDPDFRRIVGRN